MQENMEYKAGAAVATKILVTKAKVQERVQQRVNAVRNFVAGFCATLKAK